MNRQLSRRGFLKTIFLKTSGAYWALFLGPSIKCSGAANKEYAEGEQPVLIGLSQENYRAFNLLAEVLLGKPPGEDFDPGATLDRYLYQGSRPLEQAGLLQMLLWVTRSRLISLFFDLSLTPLVHLERRQREERLFNWKKSSFQVKAAVYKTLRQAAWLLQSSHEGHPAQMGYNYNRPIRLYKRPAI